MNFACRAGIAIVAELASSPPRSEPRRCSPPRATWFCRPRSPARIRARCGSTRAWQGRSFKAALGDSLFREQYLDAVAAIINAQEAAGLDIVTDGDSRFDLAVGGKSWFFYPIERLGGISGHRDTSRGWMARHGLAPGQDPVGGAGGLSARRSSPRKLTRGPLEYAALWQVAQRLTDRPVKFGAICAPGIGQHAVERALRRRQGDDARSLRHHERGVARAGRRRLPGDPGRGAAPPRPDDRGPTAPTPISNSRPRRSTASSPASMPRSGCIPAGAIPNQQRVYWEVPSYERALPHLLQLNCDVHHLRMRQLRRQGPAALRQAHKTDKKIGIGVVNHCNTVVEPAEHVAGADPQGARIHPEGAARHHHRLRLRPRGPVAPHRLLQMRGAGRGHQHRAPRARPARSARPRRRPEALFRDGGGRVRPGLSRRNRPPRDRGIARCGPCEARTRGPPRGMTHHRSRSLRSATRERRLFRHIHRLSCRHVVEKRSLQIPERLCRNQPMRESSLQIS